MKKLLLVLFSVSLFSCSYEYKLHRNLVKTRKYIDKNLDKINQEIMQELLLKEQLEKDSIDYQKK